MRKLFYFTLILFVNYVSIAQSKENTSNKIALEYMEAYGHWDFDKMKTFYSENIHFEDPTAKDAFKQTFIFEGKENVYTFFKNVFEGKFENAKPTYVNFVIEKNFTSGSYTVINSTFECILPTSWFKKDSNETIFISIPFTTVLSIENGLINSHIDYGNYTKYFEQINAQIKE